MATSHRQGRRALPVIIGALLIVLATPEVGRAQDGKWQFGSAPSFSSGKYGTDTRTEVLHTPITARRLFGDGDVTFVFPITCIWGDGGVTVVNGSPVRQQRLANAAGGRAATSGRTAPAGSGSARNCGMGDIVVRGRYYLLDERRWLPTIALRGHVKAPTASAERGLGTGKPDEGVGLEVSRTIAGGTLAMVDGGYTVIGKPAGVDYNNNWWYDVGIGQDIRKVVNLSVFFEEYRTIVRGLSNPRDVLAAVSVTGASGWRFQVSGEFGLSDGAPDHGLTFGASRRF
ncbi:MAG TPA: transporter [Vicinamibacterales bacterium]